MQILPQSTDTYIRRMKFVDLRVYNDCWDQWTIGLGVSLGNVIIQKGWRTFLHDNEIFEGDTLIFRHITLNLGLKIPSSIGRSCDMADRSFIIRVEFDKFPITYTDISLLLILPPAMVAYLRMVGVVQLRLHNDKGNTWIVVAGLNAGSAIFQEGWGRFLLGNGVNEGDTILFSHVGLHIFNVFIFDDKGNIKSAPAKGDLPLIQVERIL
ncbi:B3 domain-containing protein [Striga asiatica]|uniref:B3 domain-containing protein n=1 Tax=Striga asiatica TaxID=4170 RepID=A0A5A7RD63_STRAF|nr:B3 domain-containing protein [Striga asiatica]